MAELPPLRQRLEQLREQLAHDCRCQQVLAGSWESDEVVCSPCCGWRLTAVVTRILPPALSFWLGCGSRGWSIRSLWTTRSAA